MTTNCMAIVLLTPPLFSISEDSHWIGVTTLHLGVVRIHPDETHEVLWHWEVMRDQLSNFVDKTDVSTDVKRIDVTLQQQIRNFHTKLDFTFTVDFKEGTVRGESGEIVLPAELFGGNDRFKLLGMELSARRTNTSVRPQGRVKTPNLKNSTYPKPKVRKGQPRF